MDQARGALILALAVCGCAVEQHHPSSDAGFDWADFPFATELVEFSPGPGSGFGAERLPVVVLGPPQGHGVGRGSMDVLSLGRGGQIVLGFAPRQIVDGPGDDLIVFENAFWANDHPNSVFSEGGLVEVSDDGQTWHAFACEPDISAQGCAGFSPTLSFDPQAELSPEVCGGDSFDLGDLGLQRVRYLRITDLSHSGESPSAGFDLDAVGLIHFD